MSAQFQKKVEIVIDFLNKVGTLEIERAGEHLADDAIMVFPYLDDLNDVVGKAAIVEMINSTVPKMFERMDFTYDAWYEISDPDVLIAEYRSHCPRLDNGGTYKNVYIGVFHFKNDKITLYKEYLNPLRLNSGAG